MAEYWIEYTDNDISERVSSPLDLISKGLTKLSHKQVRSLYAEGSDIDFENYIGIQLPVVSFNTIVYRSNISECILDHESIGRREYNENISFIDCKIENMTLSALVLNSVSFSNCQIVKLIIDQCTINTKFRLTENCKIDQFNVNNNHQIKTIIIEDSEIKSVAIFSTDISKIFFKSSRFILETFVLKGKINDFQISNCWFNDFKINEASILNTLNISNGINNSNIEFNLCQFDVKEDVRINKFKGKIVFQKVQTKEKITFRFKDSKESEFQFNRCYFANEVLFQGQTFNGNKNILINETVFKDLVLFDDDYAKSLQIKESLFQNGILLPINIENIQHFAWYSFKKNKENKKITGTIHSSVWCMLKNQALSRNDKINALEYKRYEMNSYSNELRAEKNKCQEKIVLWLNRVSNNHGLGWFRGICFTAIVWFVSYVLFAMSSDSFEGLNFDNYTFLLTDRSFWIDAFNFLWIPHGIDILTEGMENNLHVWWSSLFMIFTFILGKIAIAYGIFQTISAFRKHGQL